MDILFVIAEAHPFAKTGGLGEVGGSLPAALNKEKNNVRVIMPKYRTIPQELRQQIKKINEFTVELGWRKQYCALEELVYSGVHYYFIDNEYYFNREKLYGYDDEAERFAFFCKAVLESISRMDGFEAQIIHCNDWHTSLIPLMLQENYGDNDSFQNLKTVFTIHNLMYQGIFPHEVFDDVLGYKGNTSAWRKMEYNGNINYLKTALMTADIITTVSQTYALEIQDPQFGEGLNDIIHYRRDRLFGVLNGIDTERYDPGTDQNLAANYRSSLKKKEENKRHLQEILNLPEQNDVMVVSVISRLVEQKGIDLLAYIMEEMLEMKMQIVVLGTGDIKYEEMLKYYQAKYHDKMAVRITYDDKLAHKIYCGADMILVPSLFEPCGLTQMIAMRYGTLPVVRETGGLKDSVIPYNKFTGEGNGFSFANYNAHELLDTIKRAARIFYDDKALWKHLVNNALQSDFSWKKSAQRYVEIYEKTL